jgi:thiol-disulfide isomerase/thioredoxin
VPAVPAPLRAPELGPGAWVQGPPVSLAAARGRPALVEFWEATCVNCLRTLPYLAGWHRRYATRGLTIVGVHTPEFEVTRDAEVVAAAVAAEGIPYPVLLDADETTWDRFANKVWPARYLIDGRGYIRFEHFGEGAYGDTERWIQRLLGEAGDPGPFPEPMAPLRPEDRPGAFCARPTAELHLGWHRGRMAGPVAYRPGEVVAHPRGNAPAALEDGTFVARGRWRHEAEYLEAAEAGAELELAFTAAGANLVVAPPAGEEGAVEVELIEDAPTEAEGRSRPGGSGAGGRATDGRRDPGTTRRIPVPPDLASPDLVEEGANGHLATRVRWHRPRMLALLAADDFAPRRLVVRFLVPGARAYAFSFTGCVVPREGARPA